MNLFILRHGEAEASAATDAARRLTPRGEAEVAAVVRKSAKELQAVRQVYVSPYVRAQQTAKIALEVLGDRPIETTELITPDGNVDGVIRLLESRDLSNVLLVSHQPLVGELVNGFTGQPPGYYSMATAALASIDLDPIAMGLGDLNWLR
ncbi:phosphohistidine phosphatase SixA [Aurantivibrio plasticivorans]